MGRIARLARRTAARFIPQLATTLRCSGCGRAKDDVAQLVSGPGVYLCDGCFTQAAKQLAPRRPQSNSLRCRFCRQLRSSDNVTQIGSVAICADCLGLMDVVLAEARDAARPAT
jgi:ATP-dependent Clp protease ATP-binding subunit ClpX